MISGEQFQALAEVSFCKERNCIIDSQKIQTNLNIIDNFYGPALAQYSRIFIYSHDVHYFFEKLGEFLPRNCTIITHNSDIGVDSSALQYLDSDKYRIKKWFCQNRYIDHPKLFSLPIGIANSQWRHGNQKELSEVIQADLPKKFLAYKNFEIDTNQVYRSNVNIITNFNGFPMGLKTSFVEYLKIAKQSIYMFSPAGNGIDCHRIWECLSLGTVPIVEDHECHRQFKHLPILFIDNWHDVTPEFLKQPLFQKRFGVNAFKEPIKELDINYWKKLICDTE